MQQSFTVAAAEIRESCCIAIVCLNPNIIPLSQGHVLPVIKAVIHAIRRITVTVCGIGNRLSSAKQRFEGNARRYRCDGSGSFHEGSSAYGPASVAQELAPTGFRVFF